jgi:hypothetical protein
VPSSSASWPPSATCRPSVRCNDERPDVGPRPPLTPPCALKAACQRDCR